jgi:hypothetical protein
MALTYNMAQCNGIKFVAVLQPYTARGMGEPDLQEHVFTFYSSVLQTAHDAKVPWGNSIHAFQNMTIPVFLDYVHLNPDGHLALGIWLSRLIPAMFGVTDGGQSL